MVGLLRFWSAALGFGLLGLWLADYMQSEQFGSWVAWVDGLCGAAALILAVVAHPSRRIGFRTALPAVLAVVLFAMGAIASAGNQGSELVWWNFFFGAAFVVLALVSAYGGPGVVIRHPRDARLRPREPRRPAGAPPPGLSIEEIEEYYGNRNLAGFEYQERAGYAEHTPDEVPNLFGVHFGKGPKGYLRGDTEIADEISEKLARRGDLDASLIEVEVSLGDVTLRGKVHSRVARRVAEAVCDSVLGVKDVHNELEILETAA